MFENCKIGLKDKNGVEIKCGDTLREIYEDPDEGTREFICKVVYRKSQAAFMMQETCHGKKFYESFECYKSKDYEVIKNKNEK